MIYRIAIANVPADVLADSLQATGFSATIYPNALGVGAWGKEPTTVIEWAGWEEETATALWCWAVAMLRKHGEQCAYVVKDGASAFLWHADNRIERMG